MLVNKASSWSLGGWFSASSRAWKVLAGFQLKAAFMEVTPCELDSGRPSEDKDMSRPRALCVAVWVKVPDSIIHLDLAVETSIQDIDLAFVCRPRLSSKHFDPPGNKRYLCSHRKSLWHLISHRCPFPSPPPS